MTLFPNFSKTAKKTTLNDKTACFLQYWDSEQDRWVRSSRYEVDNGDQAFQIFRQAVEDSPAGWIRYALMDVGGVVHYIGSRTDGIYRVEYHRFD